MSQRPITVRLDADDHRMLAAEAARLGVGVGTLSRMLIRGALRGGSGIPDSRTALSTQRDQITALAARRGARNVRLFGSRARGDAAPTSDVDLLVDLEPGRSMLDLVGLSNDLEELLGQRVDVITEAELSPHLRDRIRHEARPL